MVVKTKTYFFLAILLRLWILPFFYHPDLKSQHFHFQFLATNHVVNIFSFLSQNRNQLPYTDTFNYLPTTYLAGGIYQAFLRPFLGSDFAQWLNDWGPDKYTYPSLPIYLFYLKFPYLVFDILLATLLYRFYQSRKILLFWLFNPFTLYLIYFQGNFDILPTLFTFFAFYLSHRRKPQAAFLSLGLAISLKMYALLFLPYLILTQKKLSARSLLVWATCLSLPLLPVLPYLFSPELITSFSGSGLTQKILEVKFLNLPIFPILYLLNLLAFVLPKTRQNLSQSLFNLAVIFSACVNFHPQWLIWFIPFYLPLLQTQSPKRFALWLLLIFSLAWSFLINDNFLNLGHLVAINPLFADITNLNQFLTLRFHLSPVQLQTYLKFSLGLLLLFNLFPHVDKK